MNKLRFVPIHRIYIEVQSQIYMYDIKHSLIFYSET